VKGPETEEINDSVSLYVTAERKRVEKTRRHTQTHSHDRRSDTKVFVVGKRKRGARRSWIFFQRQEQRNQKKIVTMKKKTHTHTDRQKGPCCFFTGVFSRFSL
jgi:hypothetical protein